MALRPILEVYDKDTGYEGDGRCQEPWWRQMAAIKQLSATLKEILVAARERRWKSVRRGGGGGDIDTMELEYGEGSDGSRDASMETGDAQVDK